jgi:hypothetical protein
MRARITLFSAILLVVIIFSCTKENTSDAIPLNVVDLDTIVFHHSMKGWELYSWPNGHDWNYGLLPGTNRLKSYNEVVNSPWRVTGIQLLKEMLLILPEGESVFWIDESWLESIWIESYYDLQLPDMITVAIVKDFCEKSGIELGVTN